jgi:pimeloyl-ACP methyl ester carboxylesterase
MLVDAGYRAISVDLRGFGDSELPAAPYDMAALVGDLGALAGALGLARFHLVGHSLGGMVAQKFAIAHPDALASLALVATTSHNGKRASAFGRAVAELSRLGFDAAVADPALRRTLEGVLADAFPAGPPPLELFRRGLDKPDPAQAYGWQTTIDFSTKDQLGAITCPVLVVHGTADMVIPLTMGKLIHEALPGSRFVALPGAGHLVQVERADDLNRELRSFLAGVNSPA